MMIAYNLDKASDAVCVSVDTLRRAIACGDLVAHTRANKQLILAEDLRAWVEAGPTEGSTPRRVAQRSVRSA